MCHNPVFLHIISLTVPSSTEPVGSNPFDDEDDEEETAAVQPNSSPANVKKEEVVAKTLVNRKHLLLSPFPRCVVLVYSLLLLLCSSVFSLSGYFSAWLPSVDHVLINTRVHCVLCFMFHSVTSS